MSWKIDVLEADRIVHITTFGTHKPADIDRLTVEALEVGEKHAFFLYLVDEREMVPDLRTLEIYHLPKRLVDLGVTSEIRIALVISGDSPKRKDFDFYGDRLVTFGKLNLRLFVDSVESALAWLRGS